MLGLPAAWIGRFLTRREAEIYQLVHDLPGGGRRLDQTADGYVATIVSGEAIAENGAPTAARPGRLIRGRRPAPAS